MSGLHFSDDQLRKAGYILQNGNWVKGKPAQKEDKAPVKAAVAKKTYSGKEKAYIERVLNDFRMPYEVEHLFWEGRRFRFDFAVPMSGFKLAIEYEGIMMVPGGKSRHTTIVGFSQDSVKYNRAALLGWTVLRYTAKTYQNFPADLAMFIECHPIARP